MLSFRDDRALVLARIGAVLLLCAFLVSVVKVPPVRVHVPGTIRQHLTATLTDQDASDKSVQKENPGKLPLLAPDGRPLNPREDLLSRSFRFDSLRMPAELPFILPMHFLYTQVTSSGL